MLTITFSDFRQFSETQKQYQYLILTLFSRISQRALSLCACLCAGVGLSLSGVGIVSDSVWSCVALEVLVRVWVASLILTVVVSASFWVCSPIGGVENGLVGSVFVCGLLAWCVVVRSEPGELFVTGVSRAATTSRIAAVRAGLGEPLAIGVGFAGCIGCFRSAGELVGVGIVAVGA